MTKFQEIIALLNDNNVIFELVEHEPATTTEHAGAVTKWPIEGSAKAIVFKLETEFVLCVVRGDNKVDYNKLKKFFGSRKARLANAIEVKQAMGVEIGACYPFPRIADLKGITDETLAKQPKISFSPGSRSHHIRLAWSDYVLVAQPLLIDLKKD